MRGTGERVRRRIGRAIAPVLTVACLVSAGGASAAPQAGKSVVAGYTPSADLLFSAAILVDDRIACSGSVISPTAVLTAAHCLFEPSRMSVRAGTFSAREGTAIQVTAAVAPADPKKHDLAVLRLAAPTPAPAIKLGTADEEASALFPGQLVRAAGFGVRAPFTFRKRRAGLLRTTELLISTRCSRRRLARLRFRPASDLCAVHRFGKRRSVSNVCHGDSGGPLIGLLPDGPRLFGVANRIYARRDHGYLCGDPKGVAIYERVTPLHAFITASAGL